MALFGRRARHDRASEAARTVTRLGRLLALAVLPLLAHCAGAPRLDGIVQTHAVPPSDTTKLDQQVLAELGNDESLSGVRLIEDNTAAFAYRTAMAAAA